MDNERNNETQELMQPPRSLRILHYVDVVVGIGLIILGYFYISNAGLMYYRCQNEITEDYMQEYVKFYQAELKSIETYLYLGDTENYPQYCYKPKANKYLQRNFELSKISGETEKEIDRLLAINDDEIVRVVNEMLPEFDKIRDIIDVNQNPKQYGISDLRKNLSPLKDKERCSKLIKLMDKMYLEIEKIPMEPTDV
ncbi:MAG TPA: hypothetical protein PK465_07060 [Saccharofermentans sp.]|nr:hypothetical protein [Saccharofermentans sp.]HPQ32770.1 hypothetical protein [Saccharofermentans sp.]